MSTPPAQPPELAALRERMAELVDLYGAMRLLGWDQSTYMPPGGAESRGDQFATLERLCHNRLVDPALGGILEVLEPWAAELDPDSDDARALRWARRDHEKAVRVPPDLVADMARAATLGHSAWLQAVAANDFSVVRDALEHHVELRHRYAACFPDSAHPYDVLLDDFEPGLTVAELRPLFGGLVDELRPLVRAAGDPGSDSNDGVFAARLPIDRQRAAITAILEPMGFDPQTWRLDDTHHPFAQSPGPGDVRITTRYREDDFAVGFYSALHEFGHGLYEEGIGAQLRRTLLHDVISLGFHESQSRLWENLVGRGRPYCRWLLPRLQQLFPGHFNQLDPDRLYTALNTVRPSLVRTDADETTYNLHIALRLDLELRLMEGTLAAADLPEAFAAGMERLLGVEVPDDARGVLQDVHWPQGLWGYFPTYTLGNLMAAQLWATAQREIDDLDGSIERGEFGLLREWLRDRVHRHGRKFEPRELLRRVTGEELSAEPFLAYLRGKLTDSGVLGTPAAS